MNDTGDVKYLVVHNNGADRGWTMLCTGTGRSLTNLDAARTRAEEFVKSNPASKALIVEAVYTVQTEFPPVRIRRFK